MYKTASSGFRPSMQTEVANGPQIYDLLQYSRVEREAKDDFRQKIQDLRDWENYLSLRQCGIYPALIRMQRMQLRRRVHIAVKAYKEIRFNRMKLFQNYMEDLPVVGTFKRLAS